ncbi:GNAT family N-acetyltransferase [Streptomyces sp. NPDC046727]|uniref:GNAT family N-acetyltransferase n=1 Tax=Streptomyces sp. NPDC046727 TaxID=3155373 RepID=UPI0033F19674
MASRSRKRGVLSHVRSRPTGAATSRARWARWEVSAASAAAQCRRLFVAERDGRVAGAVRASLLHDSSVGGRAEATPHVHPDHRGHGVGHALAAAAEKHLAAVGATHVYAWTNDEPGTHPFAERHGYRRSRAGRVLRLDLTAAAPPLLPLPTGVRLHTGRDLDADPQSLYVVETEAGADEPSDGPADATTYEDWLRRTWERPFTDLDLTSVVSLDGEVVSFTLAATDGRGRHVSAMPGTRRAFRGRGLARLAKTASLHRARDADCTDAFTGNDAANAPMLAISQAFGYRPFSNEWRYVHELGRGSHGEACCRRP